MCCIQLRSLGMQKKIQQKIQRLRSSFFAGPSAEPLDKKEAEKEMSEVSFSMDAFGSFEERGVYYTTQLNENAAICAHLSQDLTALIVSFTDAGFDPDNLHDGQYLDVQDAAGIWYLARMVGVHCFKYVDWPMARYGFPHGKRVDAPGIKSESCQRPFWSPLVYSAGRSDSFTTRCVRLHAGMCIRFSSGSYLDAMEFKLPDGRSVKIGGPGGSKSDWYELPLDLHVKHGAWIDKISCRAPAFALGGKGGGPTYDIRLEAGMLLEITVTTDLFLRSLARVSDYQLPSC
eukprot:TRINITY_DN7646_c0_g2_i1.p1 TRINITY_DN7646_c0_g2~~TRINITY_DN7646_c0_g2_i1.p1  ORF type:complete len:288 (-),score=58.44 TRINITY_DN7646_c0_g2_i1:213-1076(-)